MTDEDARKLQYRLTGAAAVFFVLFLLTWLLPSPDEQGTPEGAVVIPLHPQQPQQSQQPQQAKQSDAAVAAGDDGAREPRAAGASQADRAPAASRQTGEAQAGGPSPQVAVPPAPTPREAPAATAENTETARKAPATSAAPEAAPKPASRPSSRPTAEPRPAADSREAAPTPAGKGRWWIQAASYSDREMAELGQQRISDAGHASRLKPVTVNGRDFWRLQAGPFANREQAEAVLSHLQTGGFQGARVLSAD